MDNLKRIYEQIEQAPAYSKEAEDFKLWVLTIIKREMEVRDDTPLPESHGRLIDAGDLWDAYHANDYDFYEALDDTETIIPATKEEKQIKKSCANCRYDSGHSSACIECCNYSMWILNQTATKEGEWDD